MNTRRTFLKLCASAPIIGFPALERLSPGMHNFIAPVNNVVSTGNPALDKILDGGFHYDTVNVLYGTSTYIQWFINHCSQVLMCAEHLGLRLKPSRQLQYYRENFRDPKLHRHILVLPIDWYDFPDHFDVIVRAFKTKERQFALLFFNMRTAHKESKSDPFQYMTYSDVFINGFEPLDDNVPFHTFVLKNRWGKTNWGEPLV